MPLVFCPQPGSCLCGCRWSDSPACTLCSRLCCSQRCSPGKLRRQHRRRRLQLRAARLHAEPGRADHPLPQGERRLPAGRGAAGGAADVARGVRRSARQADGGRMSAAARRRRGHARRASRRSRPGRARRASRPNGRTSTARSSTPSAPPRTTPAGAGARREASALELLDKDGTAGRATHDGYNLGAEEPRRARRTRARHGAADPARRHATRCACRSTRATSARPFRDRAS